MAKNPGLDASLLEACNLPSPYGLRLAARFLIELGRPARFDNEATLTRWAGIMDGLLSLSGLDYDEFRWFIIWATRLDELGNSFTAKNLRLAKDPGASLERQFDMAYSIYSDETRHKLREMLVRRRTEEDEEAQRQRTAEDEEAEFERIRAALAVPDDFRCPYCEYDAEGQRKKWCRDCYDEMRGEGESACVLGQGLGECPECLASTLMGGNIAKSMAASIVARSPCRIHGCVRCAQKLKVHRNSEPSPTRTVSRKPLEVSPVNYPNDYMARAEEDEVDVPICSECGVANGRHMNDCSLHVERVLAWKRQLNA